MSWKNRALTFVILLLIFLVYEFPIKVTSGPSMFPTICDGDVLIGIRYHRSLKRGDIITGLQTSERGTEHVIKRVIGLPGDHVKFWGGAIYVNGNRIEEDYLLEDMISDQWNYEVPEKQVFVLGDNRNNSFDSRYADMISFKQIDSLIVYNVTEGCLVE